MVLALIQELRPRQWLKNGILFAGLLFTLDQDHSLHAWLRVLGGFACFCALASAIYIFNDLCDLEQDRKHPRKRLRPLASGRLSRVVASAAMLSLLVSGLAGATALDGWFLLSAIAYAGVTIAYSLWLKHLVILDVMTLSAGFVLRAVAGAAVIHVEISPWLLVCTTLGALFLGFAKRRAELSLLEEGASDHRRSLEEYSVALLDKMITIASTATLIAYCLYTISSKTGAAHPLLMLTIFPVVYGLFRFLYLVHRREAGGDPTAELLEDRPLVIAMLVWAVASGLILLLDGG
ncbi:MAG: decaprenyl-phosphate phosphoribosyltransferase [Armatimonadetes bacterium]|nr:decaprenyl-phosphate phosphoribosyltransferase [Armatimonadota bacterium]